MNHPLGSHDLWLLIGLAQLVAGSRLLALSLTWWSRAVRERAPRGPEREIELVG